MTASDPPGRPATPARPTDRPEHSAESPVSMHALTVAYDRRPVLWDVDYDAPPGQLVAVVGPNGAGKSTLIKACLGLVPPAAGQVEFWGQPLARVRTRVGYVPQRESVDWSFPVSALDVACMGRYRRIGWCRPIGRRHREAAMACLDRVGLADVAHRQIDRLSGGQQQRVFLARALAQEADLYFMDEPFSGVDAATERAILDVLRDMRSQGRTVIVVHHDLQTVSEYFDQVMLLNMRVVAAGRIQDVFHRENIQKTYGGRLTLLAEAAEALAQDQRRTR